MIFHRRIAHTFGSGLISVSLAFTPTTSLAQTSVDESKRITSPCKWGNADYSWIIKTDDHQTIVSAVGDKMYYYPIEAENNRLLGYETTIPRDFFGAAPYTFDGNFYGYGSEVVMTFFGNQPEWLSVRNVNSELEITYLGQPKAPAQINWGAPGYAWSGDFNGDGIDDIATANGQNVQILSGLLQPNAYARPYASETWKVGGIWGSAGYTWSGDFNGDGKSDIASANGSRVIMNLSTGASFEGQDWRSRSGGTPQHIPWGAPGYSWSADFNGDGKTDLASANGGNVTVLISTGVGFEPSTWTVPNRWGAPGYTWAADFNVDGNADIVTAIGCELLVHFSDGKQFSETRKLDVAMDGGFPPRAAPDYTSINVVTASNTSSSGQGPIIQTPIAPVISCASAQDTLNENSTGFSIIAAGIDRACPSR